MRLVDKWVYDSGASHHMTANKKYFATYKKFSSPVNISLADKGTIMAYGFGQVNIEMLVEGKCCPGYLEDVWYVPDIGRHLFSVLNAAEHGISIIIKCQQDIFQCVGQLVAIGGLMNVYDMDMRAVIPREPAEVNIATSSETLQPWHECFGHQDSRHVRKVLERMEMNMITAEMGGFCEGCVLGNAHRNPFIPRSDRSQVVGERSKPMLLDQCQRSRFGVQSTMCVSMIITASIAGFSSSSKRIKFPSVYAHS